MSRASFLGETLSRRTALLSALALPLTAAPLEPTHAATERLGFDELYGRWSVEGLRFSARVESLTGQPVRMRGFMAPPLKAEADFFVLSREPMALCPFCATNADWPADIVVVYLRRATAPVEFSCPIEAEGLLERGSWTDPGTGFVSQLRLRAATFRSA